MNQDRKRGGEGMWGQEERWGREGGERRGEEWRRGMDTDSTEEVGRAG